MGSMGSMKTETDIQLYALLDRVVLKSSILLTYFFFYFPRLTVPSHVRDHECMWLCGTLARASDTIYGRP